MRVIAGEFKSRQLKSVESNLTRPTTDKNKENLFNVIGPWFSGGTCLDLFGGTGGLGIEAISRGMDKLYTVDKQFKAFKVIQENFKTLKIEDRAFAYKLDYKKALERFNEENLKFDLVLLDPPYGLKINEEIIDYLKNNQMLNDECIIVVEDLNEETFDTPKSFDLWKSKSFGITTINIYKYEA